MNRRKPKLEASGAKRKQRQSKVTNRNLFQSLVNFVVPTGALFLDNESHGKIKWIREHLAAQALIWSWQDSKPVTDAFE